MNQSKRTSLLNILTICAAAASLLSFLLPLISIDAWIATVSQSGLDVVLTAIEEGFAEKDYSAIGIALSLLCSIVSLVCAAMAGKNTKCTIYTAVASAAALLLMIVAMSMSSDSYIELKPIDYADTGFYVFVIMHIVVICLAVSDKYLAGSKRPEFGYDPNFGFTVCPKCGAKVEKTAVFCRYCGTRREEKPAPAPAPVPEVEEKVACPVCGCQINKTAAFCRYCGTRKEEKPASAPEPEEKTVCPQCGGQVNKKAAFCQHCGARIESDVGSAINKDKRAAIQAKISSLSVEELLDNMKELDEILSKGYDHASRNTFEEYCVEREYCDIRYVNDYGCEPVSCGSCGTYALPGDLYCSTCGGKLAQK